MIENLLERLTGVKTTKNNEWVALCPVHNEKTPSLGLKLTPEGKIICHCFGCGASGLDVIHALNLDPSELFPPEDSVTYTRQKRVYLSADTVLWCLQYEATILSLAACDIVNGCVNVDDTKRILLAQSRIEQACEFVAK